MKHRLNHNAIKWFLNFWPPYLGAGIHVNTISKDWRYVQVSLKKRWYNSNYFNTAFGGSLYSMIDPFFALMVMKSLGRDYVVWDKHGEIRFITPGRAHVIAEFRVSQKEIDDIKETMAQNQRCEPVFTVDIIDTQGVLVAQAIKTLSVKRALAQ
jgi:acyl-coenzyme A thioesterase PaaI-like protein